MGFTETIIVLPSLCTGCRACEVACSFRRTKKMAPFHASIRVQKNDLTGRMEITIKESCDVCQDQLVPFCLQVCHPRALSLGRKMG